MSRFRSFTFPSLIVFMEPIQHGHQKFILALNFCVDFAFHMVHLAILPDDWLNPWEFGYLDILEIPLDVP